MSMRQRSTSVTVLGQYPPTASSGFALGLAGLGSVWRAFHAAHNTPALHRASHALSVCACLYLVAFAGRVIAVRKELSGYSFDLVFLSGLGAFAMTVSVLGASLGVLDGVSNTAPRVLVATAAILQLAVMARFAWVWFNNRTPAAPFWYPILASVAITAITGVGVGMPKGVVVASAWAGVTVVSIVLPFIVYNVLRPNTAIAQDPKVLVMQAGPSLVSSAFNTAVAAYPNMPGHWLIHPLFALSTTCFLLTLVAVAQRLRVLRTALSPFRSTWASAGFPTAATALSSLRYWHNNRNDFTLAWSYTLVTLASVVVMCVNVGYAVRVLRTSVVVGAPKTTSVSVHRLGVGPSVVCPVPHGDEAVEEGGVEMAEVGGGSGGG